MNRKATSVRIIIQLLIIEHLVSFADFNSRVQETMDPVHVVNIEIMDNHEEATLGAFVIYQLCQKVRIKVSFMLFILVHRTDITGKYRNYR